MKKAGLLMLFFLFALNTFGQTHYGKVLFIFIRFSDDYFENYVTDPSAFPPYPTDPEAIGWNASTPINATSSDALPHYYDRLVEPVVDVSGNYEPKTISHYFYQMSNGSCHVTGDVFPYLYIPRNPSSYYYGTRTKAFTCASEAVTDLDPQINFSSYDWVFFCYRTFYAVDGFSGLVNPGGVGFGSADGVTIRGSLQQGFGVRQELIGVSSHEFSHRLSTIGLTNLDDYNAYAPHDFSGIGMYGIMGHGTGDKYNHTTSMCGHSRILEGWATEQLITGNVKNMPIEPMGENGVGSHIAYKIQVDPDEYFIIENRQRWGQYDRYLSGDGILIYHFDENGRGATDAKDKYHPELDIECADGRWDDKGWSADPALRPTVPNPVHGQDNIEWCRYEECTLDSRENNILFNEQYNGNTGDATDFFDGMTYTAFTDGTNPSACTYESDVSSDLPAYDNQSVPTRIAVMNIRRDPDYMWTGLMYADIYLNNWTGHITQNTTWSSDVHISGDIIIDPGVTLTIEPGVVVEVEPGFDDQKGNGSSSMSEIIVNGSLIVNGSSSNRVVFKSGADVPSALDWYGIRNYGTVVIDYADIEDTRYAVRHYSGTASTSLEHCRIKRFYNYGVHIATGAVSVRDCIIEYPAASSARGINIATASITAAVISGNTIRNFSGTGNNYGIYASQIQLPCSISGNSIDNLSGSSATGVYLNSCDNITVNDNHIGSTGTLVHGVRLLYSDDCTVMDNDIRHCIVTGIECYKSDKATIRDNKLIDLFGECQGDAILLDGSGTIATIDGNHICAYRQTRGCDMAIRSENGAKGYVYNNTIEDYYGVALYVGYDGYLFCGSDDSPGNNNISINFDDCGETGSVISIFNTSGVTMEARKNYWGPDPADENWPGPYVDYGNYLSAPAPGVIVRHYRMDDSWSDLEDAGVFGADGTVYGAARIYGIAGKGLDFDGTDDYGNVTHGSVSDIFNNTADFTISAWVAPGSFPVDGSSINGASIIGQQYGTSMVFGVRGDGRLFLNMDDTRNNSPKSTSSLSLDMWQHVAVTFDNDADNCVFYINGVQAGTGHMSDPAIGVQDLLYIGWQSRTDASYRPGYFDGGIDEVRIYNYILDDDEVLALCTDRADAIFKQAGEEPAENVSAHVPKVAGKFVTVSPNPFCASTEITCRMPVDIRSTSDVRLNIFNHQGKLVRQLVDERAATDTGVSVRWDGTLDNGRKAVEGVYYYRYSAGDRTETGRIMIAK